MKIVVNPLKLKFFLCQDFLHLMPGLFATYARTYVTLCQDFCTPLYIRIQGDTELIVTFYSMQQ